MGDSVDDLRSSDSVGSHAMTLEKIGVGPDSEAERRQAEKALATRQRQIDKVEGKRAANRAKARDSVLGSRFDIQQLPSRFSEAKQ